MTFTPMIASPIVPVEAKIVGILRHFRPAGTEASRTDTPVHLNTLLEDAVSLPDMIAIFLGVLELVKLRRLLLLEPPDAPETVFGADAAFVAGDEPEKDMPVSEYDTAESEGRDGT